MKMSRYGFLKFLASCGAYLVVMVLLPLGHLWKLSADNGKNGAGSPMRDTAVKSPPAGAVAVERCGSYDSDEVYRAVRRGLDAVGFNIAPGNRVLLKPNIMAQNKPEQATVTHPVVVDAVCKIFSERGCTVTIGESSAFYQGGCTRAGFATSGIEAVAKKYGAVLLPFEATTLREITSGEALNPFYVTDAAFSHDLVVNMPKMKLHRLARLSGAIKNTYGFVVGGTKQLYHMRFQERPDYKEYWGVPLVDVYEAVMPGLTIMDAVMGLDEDGPAANGRPRLTGVILTSTNGAALDVVACGIMGFDPQWVPAVREALRRGLAPAQGDIAVIGEVPSVPYAKLPDEAPKKGLSKKLDDHFFRELIVEPRLSERKCIKCDTCIEKCAAGAIAKGDKGYPVFDYAKCIRCYCCEEYCTVRAISLHGGFTNHVIRGARQVMGM